MLSSGQPIRSEGEYHETTTFLHCQDSKVLSYFKLSEALSQGPILWSVAVL